MVTTDNLKLGHTQVVFLQGPEAEVKAMVRLARAHHHDCSWHLLDAGGGELVGALHFWVD